MRTLTFLMSLLLVSAAQADGGALARSFALPALGQHQVNPPGKSRYTLELDLTNEYVSNTTPAEKILLDGETARLALTYYGVLAPGWDWNTEIPAYVLGGGFMDRFIQGWHDVFGLPNGGREFAPDDQYQFLYERPNGTVLLNATGSGTHFGDMSVGIGWQALPQIALRAQVKLPTGEARDLTGGNTGGAFWADAALPFADDSAWSGYASAGVSVNSRSGVLSALQEQTLYFGGGGLRYRLNETFSFYSDISARSALYTGSALDPLNGIGVPARFGLSYDINPGYSLDLAFQEDLNPGASPDFGLRFALKAH
ncbi:MAG: DUF3187 family protein [Pseudomonadota bacterium]